MGVKFDTVLGRLREAGVELGGDGKIPQSMLPFAGSQASQKGIIYSGNSYGISISSTTGLASIKKASDVHIAARSQQYTPIVPNTLNTAVKAALSDANRLSMSTAEQNAAREVLGLGATPVAVSPDISVIPAATSAETLLVGGVYQHTPSAAPTYTLPNVAVPGEGENAKLNETVIEVAFSSVQTLSFVDANSASIPMLFTPYITSTTVIIFDCRWSVLADAWIIFPIVEVP